MKQATKLNQVMLVDQVAFQSGKTIHQTLYQPAKRGCSLYGSIRPGMRRLLRRTNIWEVLWQSERKKLWDSSQASLSGIVGLPQVIEGETRHTDDYLQLYHKGWHSFRTGTFRQCTCRIGKSKEAGRHIRKRSTPPSDLPYGIEISKHTRFWRHQRERTGKQTNAD